MNVIHDMILLRSLI